MNKKILKYGGIAAIALGSAALFISGSGETPAVEVVSAVFILMGIIAQIIHDRLS